MDIASILGQVVSGGISDNVAAKTGAKKQDVESVIAASLPMILGGLAKNASTSDGAQALDTAITNKHTSSTVLDDANAATSDETIADGQKALGHVFGGSEQSVARVVSKKTGVDTATVMKILAVLVPIALAYLGKQKNSKGLDAGGLASILTGQTDASGSPLTSILESVLGGSSSSSTSSGGNVIGSILGSLFGKK